MTHAQVIATWPRGFLARGLRVPDYLTRKWRQRNSIPPLYWPRIARLERARKNGITIEVLERGYAA